MNQKVYASLWVAVLLLLSACSRQQSEWQKTRETNTADAYEQFLKKYPSGEFTAQAQARAKELYEERDWQKARDVDTPEAYQAFVKQYPEGKWTEEARIRIENFTLAQAPSGPGAAAPGGATGTNGAAGAMPAAMDTSAKTVAVPRDDNGGTAPRAPVHAARTAASSTEATDQSRTPAAGQAEAGVAAGSKTSGGAGAYAVQFGAFKSGAAAATKRWAQLRQQYPALLAGLTSRIVPKKTSDGNLYRLQSTGLSEKHAREVCAALKAKSEACLVVPPANG